MPPEPYPRPADPAAPAPAPLYRLLLASIARKKPFVGEWAPAPPSSVDASPKRVVGGPTSELVTVKWAAALPATAS